MRFFIFNTRFSRLPLGQSHLRSFSAAVPIVLIGLFRDDYKNVL